MKKSAILTVLLALLIAAPAHAEDAFDRVIKTRTLNCGYIIVPPYIIKDPNTGKMSGINYDMLEAVGKYLDLKINWSTEIGVGDVAAALSANKFDVICQTMWPSAARFRGMTFANRPQFYSAIYAVARADDKRFDGDLSKANDQSIKAVAVEGDVTMDLVHERLPKATIVPLSPTIGLGDYLMQLTTKKADILFMDKGSIKDFSKTNPGQIKIVENLPPARIFGEHLAVKLGEYRLRDILDMATLQLVNDGVFEELVKKYSQEYGAELYSSTKDIAK